MSNFKNIISKINWDYTIVITLIFQVLEFLGITYHVFFAALCLIALMTIDYITKKRTIIKKFGSIKNARKLGFWNSEERRKRTKHKFIDYTLIFVSSTIVISLFNYISNVQIFNGIYISQIQEVLRIFAISIMCGIEYDSLMENIKGNFKEAEQEKIEQIQNKVKDNTIGVIEDGIDKARDSIFSKEENIENYMEEEPIEVIEEEPVEEEKPKYKYRYKRDEEEDTVDLLYGKGGDIDE